MSNLIDWIEHGYVTCNICQEKIDCNKLKDNELFVMIELDNDLLVYHATCFMDEGIKRHVTCN